MVCLKHHDREAVAVCSACGRPVCEECIVSYGGESYCSEECMQRGIAAKERSFGVIARGKNTDRKLRRRAFLYFVLLCIAAAAGYYFYTRNKEKVDASVKGGLDVISDGAKGVVNAGKGAMPGKTEYKRQRESLVQ